MGNTPERRVAPRLDVFAQASVVSGHDIYLMTVRNLSLSGAFLEGRAQDHPEIRPGFEVEVTLSAASPGMRDDEVVNIRCRGKVARIDLGSPGRPGGFGVTLEAMDHQDLERLQDLIGRLAGVQAPQRSASVG
jgi:hypothetical protein